ncbi:2,4-dienoyl-CoA reductase (NADPH2) [Pullulanibacillus pueri]|uniref:NADPH-dependent 2,4-dienoyl-CoA reductase n=1 Tax=Pullulanibacillus pueri TaxID=1437324 RepID=A0A8J2ZW83_9BACL|nr:NADPH-dependent 2,4-dienoyl-CoA reductase [Pullulanibacillus pueri]MBM7682736.1 2,4-dienoyl-CoA reductase (NADPH2) [Pullulanibacillus pueri]GGH82987.1 NADPH-dependent 2,4-dienoyl-CoA reductase [Pullulanibacillus pueri]
MNGLDYLLAPFQLAGLTLRNRVIMGSMHTGLEGLDKTGKALTTFYKIRAKTGGPGLIITGGIAVSPEGEGGDKFLGFYREEDCDIMRKMTTEVHVVGGRIAAQLFHAGRYAYSKNSVAPSAIQSPIHHYPPRALEDHEIRSLIESYAIAAKKAVELGFDAIEIMGSEGYLLNQFLSPVTNKRDDDWGGNFEKRMRFPLSVLEAVRKAVGPGSPVIFRMSGTDLIPGSTTEAETIQFAQALEVLGADALNIGIGWHESQVPTISQMVPRAGFLYIAENLKQHLRIPVIGSNRINDPKEANAYLKQGRCDLISMARPFLADPEILQKAAKGAFDYINTCVACNQACLDHAFEGKPVSCLVNPRTGREHLLTLTETEQPRKIAVVGGGAAGLEAARSLGEQGHHVTLFEAGKEIGGQLNYARRVPGKEEFNETLRYYTTELHRFRVKVVLNEEVSEAALIEGGFEEVVLATGVRPRIPDINGTDRENVLLYTDAFHHPERVGPKVAVIGAGGIACDLAHFLLEEGSRKITLLRRNGKMGAGLGKTTRWALVQYLRQHNVQFLTHLSYQSIQPEGVVIDHIGEDGEELTTLVEADTVIIAAGQESTVLSTASLEDKGISVTTIGGAKHAGELDAKRAIYEGAALSWG